MGRGRPYNLISVEFLAHSASHSSLMGEGLGRGYETSGVYGAIPSPGVLRTPTSPTWGEVRN